MVPWLIGRGYVKANCSLVGVSGVSSRCQNDTLLTDALLRGPQPYSPLQSPGRGPYLYETVRDCPDTTGPDSEKVCNAANNSNCGLMEYYDRRKNCIQIFVRDESSSPGFKSVRVHDLWTERPKNSC